MTQCQTCRGTGLVNRKTWTQGEDARKLLKEGIHPAIIARRPAYRTIVSSPCPDCPKGKEKTP